MAMFQFMKKSTTRGSSNLVIGLVSENADTRKQLRDAAATSGIGLKSVEFSLDTSKLAPTDANVIVYDLDTLSDQALDTFDVFMQKRPENTPVIVLSKDINDDVIRWFFQLRVADWLKKPVLVGELVAACGRARSQFENVKSDARCLAFIGAKGGVGTTTIAVHAAQILSGRAAAGQKFCLVDLDFENSSCCDYLDLEPAWQITDLAADPTRLDVHMFNSMISTHSSGLPVLSARRNMKDTLPLSEELVTKPMELAIQKYGNLVVDLPRTAQQWLANVVGGATDVFVVTEFTLPGLKSARRMVNQLVENFEGSVTPRVIVNKYTNSLFGTSLSSKEAKQLLGPYLAGFVKLNDHVAADAINRGVPTSVIKKNNSLLADVGRIVEKAKIKAGRA